MGCSQSVLCVATLSQNDPPGHPQQQQPQQQPGPSLLSSSIGKQRSVKLPPVRTFDADPAKAAQSAAERQEAMEAAQALLLSNQGANYRDTYVRATLVSYGGSCRVFTAVNKHSQEAVAIKTITKVRRQATWAGVCACGLCWWSLLVHSVLSAQLILLSSI
jgi:hypothetical protein